MVRNSIPFVIGAKLGIFHPQRKIPLHIAAEEDIPKTDYIFISAAQGRDKIILFYPKGQVIVLSVRKASKWKGLKRFENLRQWIKKGERNC